jgi:mono/diheme cytochrome c family protein
MLRKVNVISVAVLVYIIAMTFAAIGQAQQDNDGGGRPGGWTLPPTAKEEKNPLTADAATVAAGKEVYKKKCERCHGPGGLGDGKDADPDVQQDMDLTVARRAARNPDGVVFYKVLNGRKKPKMPAQKGELTTEQIWQVVTYVQTLRRTS